MAIQFKLKDKPNHPIVKAIMEYEPNVYKDNDLIVYYPPSSETCGWTIEGNFLGFTISEVVSTYEHNVL
tara:strand:- start:282 stop:488 length:207 start_codon:yes stop_codon:yes gene_type:complete